MAYPSSIDSFITPAGTNTLSSPDHASAHIAITTAISALETVLGTNQGTSVLKDFSAGQYPLRINSGGSVVQAIGGGTFNNPAIGTPSITGGTMNAGIFGTPTITGGAMNSGTFGTPQINVGSDAVGDIYYRSSGSALTRVAIGTPGQTLQVSAGTVPAWSSSSSTNPSCYVYLTADQSINNTTDTAISWTSESYDTDTMHDTSGSQSRITINTAGKYSLKSKISFAVNATGRRYIFVKKNGADLQGGYFETTVNPTASAQTHAEIVIDVNATATDYFEIFAYQASGGALAVTGGTIKDGSFFSAVKISS
jgi:hypothetical protein